MTASLSPAVRRALALSILVVLLFGTYAMLVRPVLDSYLRDRQTLEEQQIALRRFQEAAQELPALQARLDELRRGGPQSAGYLQGQGETLAAASLQERLKALVLSEGGQFKSAQILPASDADRARRLAVRGEMMLGLAALQRVVYELEASTPFLVLDNLDIRAIASPQRTGQAAGEILLDIRLDLYGFMRSAG